MRASFSVLLLLTLVAVNASFAASWYVDNVRGDDANEGAEVAPVKTIQKGIDLARPGDTVFLKVNREPYSEPNIDFKRGGVAGAPITLDGQGAVLSGLIRYGADQWKDAGEGIYSMPFHFPLRFKQVSLTADYKKSGFSFLYLDGRAGGCAASLDALLPGEYFLSMETPDAGGTLYVRLPAGKTPASVEILLPRPKHTALHVGKSYITVKNLTSAWASQDSFSTTKSHDLVFENVRGCYNMDQGMSHHGSQVITRNSLFDHNAATGVRDVYNDCDSTYEDCVFFENLVAGVDAMGRKHRFVKCLFLDNFGAGLSISKDVVTEVEGCTFKGAERSGVRGWKCQFSVKDSTLDRLKAGIGIGESKVTITGNAFLGCGWNYDWHFQEGWETPSALEQLQMEGNFFSGGDFRVSQKEVPLAFAEFRAQTGLDTKSAFTPIDNEKSSTTRGPIQHGGKSYGSEIPARLPEKYQDLPSPDPRLQESLRAR